MLLRKKYNKRRLFLHMHKEGHLGISLLLSAPFVSIFIILDLYAYLFIFLGLILTWSGLPDVDIYLQRFDSVSYSDYTYRFWPWVPVMKLTNSLMNFCGRYIDKVPEDYDLKSVTHRGLTHSIWFSIVFGLLLSIIPLIYLISVILIDNLYSLEIYNHMELLLNSNPFYLIPLMFIIGFLSVAFHCVGDIFTPTGIHFLTPRTDYGFTLDQFYAKNRVANRSALPLGFMMMTYAIFFGFAYGEVNIIYLIGGFVGLFITLIPIWLLFVKTRVGKWFYIIYDIFK